MRSRWPQLIATCVCFVVGMIIAAQWRTRAMIARSPILARSAEQAVMVSNLVESNAKLRKEIEELEKQLTAFRQDDRSETFRKLVEELNRLKIINGLVEVSGPGLELELAGEINVYDVQDVVNELHNAGAEAVALNDQRLVAMSIIEEQGRRIMVDGLTVTSPYRFRAIGSPDTLERACTRKGGIVDLLKSSYTGLDVTIRHRQEMTLPVYRRPTTFRYANVVK